MFNAIRAWFKDLFEPQGLGKGRSFNSAFGRYRVQYANGETSLPMCKDTALFHQEQFGGTIIPRQVGERREPAA